MNYVLLVLAGAFGCNAIPHTVAGLQGWPFPTPFAKPPGIGNSPPNINFAWGSANLLLSLAIAARHVRRAAPIPAILLGTVGFVATGAYLSQHFGEVRRRAMAELR